VVENIQNRASVAFGGAGHQVQIVHRKVPAAEAAVKEGDATVNAST
jgi:hypothetical protein